MEQEADSNKDFEEYRYNRESSNNSSSENLKNQHDSDTSLSNNTMKDSDGSMKTKKHTNKNENKIFSSLYSQGKKILFQNFAPQKWNSEDVSKCFRFIYLLKKVRSVLKKYTNFKLSSKQLWLKFFLLMLKYLGNVSVSNEIEYFSYNYTFELLFYWLLYSVL